MPDRRPLAALSVALFVMLHGPAAATGWALTSDGAHYVAIADALLREGRLVDPVVYLGQAGPSASLHWPPGFPLLIASLGLLGLDPLTAGRLLALAGGVAVVALGTRLAQRLADPGAWLVALGIVFLPALGPASTHVLSEAPATAVTLAALLLLDAVRARGTPPMAAAAAVAVAAAVWLRWSGVALLAPLALTAWWSRGATRWTLAVIAALGLAPLVLWVFTHPDAPRAAAVGGPALLVQPVTGALKVWGLFTLGLGVVPLATAAGAQPVSRRTIGLHGAFAAAHVTLLLLGALRVRMDAVDLRLLLPATPSVLFAAVALAQSSAHRWPERPLRALAVGVLVLPALFGVGRPDEAHVAHAAAALAPRLDALPAQTEVWTELPALAALHPRLRWTVLQEAPNTPWRPDARPHVGSVLAVLRAGDDAPCDDAYCLVSLSAD